MTKLRPVTLSAAMLAALTLSGCSDPEWVSVYENCTSQMVAQSEKIKASDSGDNAMAKSMGDMALSLGMAACETIKTTCEADADSKGCKAMVDSYSREQK
ncbi:MAG: hypothetical protein RPU52_03960 [Candidatus Sedimenticola sp. (ex Thyasira tokunagai)]